MSNTPSGLLVRRYAMMRRHQPFHLPQAPAAPPQTAKNRSQDGFEPILGPVPRLLGFWVMGLGGVLLVHFCRSQVSEKIISNSVTTRSLARILVIATDKPRLRLCLGFLQTTCRLLALVMMHCSLSSSSSSSSKHLQVKTHLPQQPPHLEFSRDVEGVERVCVGGDHQGRNAGA